MNNDQVSIRITNAELKAVLLGTSYECEINEHLAAKAVLWLWAERFRAIGIDPWRQDTGHETFTLTYECAYPEIRR